MGTSSYDNLKDDKSNSSSTISITSTSNNNNIILSNNNNNKSNINNSNKNTNNNTSTRNNIILILVSSLNSFLTKQCIKTHTNPKQYCIQSIEDAITLQQDIVSNSTNTNQIPIIKSPFPLGMKVRRFFTKFGFHDGRIIQIRRNYITDDNSMINRPVLLYIIKYLDGDEEDFLNYQIISLKQFYDIRGKNQVELPSCQIIPKTIYQCFLKNDKNNSTNTTTTTSVTNTSTTKNWIQIISNHTPIGVPNKKEGGIVKVNLYNDQTSS